VRRPSTRIKILGGLHVIDLETSEPLFSLSDAPRNADLDFAVGFVIYDKGEMRHESS
jgi:hypothetical protein